MGWAAPTVTYLWPTRTGLSRKVSENRKFLGRNISVICPGSCRVTETQIATCPSKKEFSSFPFLSFVPELYRVTELISEAPFFYFLIFWFFDFWSGCKEKARKEESGAPKTWVFPVFCCQLSCNADHEGWEGWCVFQCVHQACTTNCQYSRRMLHRMITEVLQTYAPNFQQCVRKPPSPMIDDGHLAITDIPAMSPAGAVDGTCLQVSDLSEASLRVIYRVTCRTGLQRVDGVC